MSPTAHVEETEIVEDTIALSATPTPAVPAFTLIEGTRGMVCDGPVCEVPSRHEAHIVARRVDEDLV